MTTHPLEKKGRAERRPSGWRLEHCGHPTAHWPYYLKAPAGHELEGCTIVSFNGLGFQTKRAASAVLDDIESGLVEVTRERCGGVTARVIGRTAMNERVDDR